MDAPAADIHKPSRSTVLQDDKAPAGSPPLMKLLFEQLTSSSKRGQKATVMRSCTGDIGRHKHLVLPWPLLWELSADQRHGSQPVRTAVVFHASPAPAAQQGAAPAGRQRPHEQLLRCRIGPTGSHGALALQVPVSARMHMRPLLHVGLRHDLTVELALGPQPQQQQPQLGVEGESAGALAAEAGNAAEIIKCVGEAADEWAEQHGVTGPAAGPDLQLGAAGGAQQGAGEADAADSQQQAAQARSDGPTPAAARPSAASGSRLLQTKRKQEGHHEVGLHQHAASSSDGGLVAADTAGGGGDGRGGSGRETSSESEEVMSGGKRHCRRSSPAAAADGAADVQVAPSLVVHSRRDQVAAAEQHHRDGEDELQEQEAGHAAAVKQFPAAPTQAATARAAAGSRQQSQPPRPSPHSPPPRPPRAAPHSRRQQQPLELQALWRVMLQVPAAQMRAARALNRRQAALAAAVGAPAAAVTSDGPALSSFRSSLREVVALLLRARVITSLPTTPLSCGGGGTSGSHHIGSGSGGSTTDSSGSGSGGSGTSSGDGSSGVGACCCCCALQQTAGSKAAVPAVPCCCWRSAAHYLHAASVAVADCYLVLADAAEKDAEWLEQEQAQQLQAAEEDVLGVGQGGEGQDGCQEGQAAAAGQQVDRYGEGKDWCQEGGEGGQERRLAGSHPDDEDRHNQATAAAAAAEAVAATASAVQQSAVEQLAKRMAGAVEGVREVLADALSRLWGSPAATAAAGPAADGGTGGHQRRQRSTSYKPATASEFEQQQFSCHQHQQHQRQQWQ
ncbi:hypothetical protein HYH02_004209 [Chlamydomonas schloesseri]|uniref:Uncharacterized protein n=1 Tax=Chlamydomonas schloesseri TaxID=2026947 RepID=A0A836B8J3_9CHLO|nr:hypothetical protein HYH02_004209 [Chlamydomonas schloesseri]|eukprot:KAG2450936.1 hypothetical protein HYH02_004209 [Chlamydomonas schloesseri]